jgi:hypothetical protein
MGFVTAIEANQSAGPYHILVALGIVVLVVGKLTELRFELPNFVLQLDNILTVDLATFGCI